MTQEEKDLLLKAICAMLPYDIKAIAETYDGEKVGKIISISTKHNIILGELYYGEVCFWIDYGSFKPYLRSMSSMTDEEKAQVQTFMDIVTDENYGDGYSPSAWDAMNGFVQYCDSHHLDHRGLIFRGLALEATEEMYKNNYDTRR